MACALFLFTTTDCEVTPVQSVIGWRHFRCVSEELKISELPFEWAHTVTCKNEQKQQYPSGWLCAVWCLYRHAINKTLQHFPERDLLPRAGRMSGW